MKALVFTKYSTTDVLKLKEVEKPVAKDEEVLIKVCAATVNRTDCAILRAKPFIMRLVTGLLRPKKNTPGTDFAGQIEALGKNVNTFKVGDRVFGFDDLGLGSHAEYITLAADKALLTMPRDISYQQAAASCEGAHYALNFINKVPITSRQKVLVNGATGAIGSAAVQLLGYFGLDVVAVCSTDNVQRVKSLGASRVIDYDKEDFTQDQESYDYIFDTAGKSSFAKCKPLLKPGGTYLSSELGPMAQNLYYPLITSIVGNKKVRFPIPTDIKGSLRFIKERIEQENFKALIDREYPLEQIIEAYKYVEQGHKIGNVVITMES
jgi:NADPH:quinone reductase-like Zn-dependent oxidoreductase